MKALLFVGALTIMGFGLLGCAPIIFVSMLHDSDGAPQTVIPPKPGRDIFDIPGHYLIETKVGHVELDIRPNYTVLVSGPGCRLLELSKNWDKIPQTYSVVMIEGCRDFVVGDIVRAFNGIDSNHQYDSRFNLGDSLFFVTTRRTSQGAESHELVFKSALPIVSSSG